MSVVSDAEITQQVREMGARNPRANELLQGHRQGDLSLRDVVYFLLLDEQERSGRQPIFDRGAWSGSRPAPP